ncbi:hypothetical protein, partial [Pseudomonas shirazica]|uniref:hypothetical protein n=1 Tax=Pseudomonas shirazica TaxID=1940636 RepID=UPI001960E705
IVEEIPEELIDKYKAMGFRIYDSKGKEVREPTPEELEIAKLKAEIKALKAEIKALKAELKKKDSKKGSKKTTKGEGK